MKRIILLTFTVVSVICSIAQVPTRMYEKGEAFEKNPRFKVSPNNSSEKKMPVFDLAPLLAEDEAVKGLDHPYRFGKSFDVNLSLNDGKWVKSDSNEVWNLKVTSPKALSLNFIFSELYLPEGAELYIFNDEGSMVYGPVTEHQNQHGKSYLTDIIKGESATIQLSIPLICKGKTRLIIQRVVHGYKNIFAPVEDPGYGQSQSCTHDVVCYSSWNNESDGVVQILLSNGNELCTGSLLNNTAQDYRPYILTAFHCIDIGNPSVQNDPNRNNGVLDQNEIDQSAEWLVRFRFRHTTCGGSTIANVLTYDDTFFRSAWHPTDFALVELQDNIINDINSVGQKVWLGWDRTGNTPTSGVGIHHPSGDIMKLSVENNQFSTSTWPNGLANAHWFVNFDDGVVEHGSSGSPILDQSKRIVGQLHGNQFYNLNLSYCDQPRAEYGRLSLSWAGGGTNATRLSNWLQPTGSTTTLNSIRQPTPTYSGISDFLCSSASLSVTTLAPGYSINHWNGSNVTFPNGNSSNPVLVSPGSSGQGWVQAVINTGGGLYTMSQTNFWVGIPTQPGSISIDMDAPPGRFTAMIDAVPSATSYKWYCDGVLSSSTTTIARFTRQPDNCEHVYCVDVIAVNECGESALSHAEVSEPPCNYYSIFPNPASTEITITQYTSKTASVQIIKKPIKEVRIIDKFGRQALTQSFGDEVYETKLNISNLQTGSYSIQINQGAEMETYTIIKE